MASSFLSVAIAKSLRNALGGSSKERPELADTPIALSARVLPVPVRGAEGLVTRLFEPLGYDVATERIALDDELGCLVERWVQSPYVALNLSGTVRLRNLLSHIYVLVPVLDKCKHYFVDRHELEKLIEKGESWLGAHPKKELIATRYLRFRRSWAREILMRLAIDEAIEEDAAELPQRVAAEGGVAEGGSSEVEPGGYTKGCS